MMIICATPDGATHETVVGFGSIEREKFPHKVLWCVVPSSFSQRGAFSLSSDPNVCFVLGDGLLHHGPCDGAILIGDGFAHTLHGDVRRIARVRAQTDDN